MASVQQSVDLGVNSVTGGPGAFSELEEGIANAATKGVAKGLSKSKEVQDTIAKLFAAGFRGEAQKLGDLTKQLDDKKKASVQEIAQMERDLETELDAERRKSLDREIREKKKLLKKESNELQKRINADIQKTERQMELLERADKRSQKSWYTKAEQAGAALGSGVENISGTLTSGSIDPTNLAQGLSEGLSGVGDIIAGKLAQAGMAETAAALSTASVALAGAAAGIGAIVAVFAAAYGQTKELNEEIMSTVSGVDLLTGSGKQLKGSLEQVRKAAMDLAYETRLETKDIITMMGAFNQAGITVKEVGRFVKGYGDNISKLTDLTQTAIFASKGLGIEVSDFAEFAKTFRDMGSGLSDVQGAFGMISEGARKAGMNTKDFFTAINEASTGMALYNFRVGDTVGLFTDLVSILGEDLAKERIGLEKTYGQMSFQDRYRNVMTTGGRTTKGIVTAEADRQAAEFARKFGDEVIGLGAVGGAGGIDVKALGKLNEKQFQELLRATYATDAKTQEMAKQQLQTLYTIAKGTRGGTGNLAASLGALSKTGEIAMELAQGQALLGGKTLAEAASDPVLRMFLEETMGMSGEQLEQNVRIERALREEFENMKLAGLIDQNADFYQELARGTLSQTETLEQAAQAEYSMLERLGQQTYMETKSIANTVSNVIAQLLEKIAGFVEYMASIFGKENNDQVTFKAMQSLNRQAEQNYANIADRESKIAELEKQLTAEKDVSKRTALSSEIKSLEEANKADSRLIRGTAAAQGVLRGGGSIKEAELAGAESQFKELHGMSSAQFAAGLTPEQRIKAGVSAPVVSGGAVNTPVVPSMMGGDPGSMAMAQAHARQQAQERKTKEIMEGKTSISDAEAEGFKVQEKELEASQETVNSLSKIAGTLEETEKKNQKPQKDALEKMVRLLEDSEKQKVIAGSGLDAEKVAELQQTQKGRESLIRAIRANTGASDTERRTALSVLGVGRSVEDFIYRGNGVTGQITPIDKSDQFFGAKPGGAIDKAMNSGGVVVNISGVGSADEVARAVASTLKRMGYGNVRKYKS